MKKSRLQAPWLSLHRTIRITVDGIRYRLFRASVTVAVIVVAVAFLMNILSESLIGAQWLPNQGADSECPSDLCLVCQVDVARQLGVSGR